MSQPHVSVERGDITKVEVDAIVNAANPIMLGGGGVDGAIHAAAGPELLEACRKIPTLDGKHSRLGERCPFGEARITPGFALPAKYVIHAVGPIYHRDPDPEATLRSAYEASLALAREHGLRSIAFPGISTGAYGFPLEPAARIGLTAALQEWGSVERVRFVMFDPRVFAVFAEVAGELGAAVID